MKKIIRSICLILILFSVSIMSAIVYGFYSLPDDIYSLSGKDIDVGFYSCSFNGTEKAASKSVTPAGEYKVNISLFNKIPVKVSNLTVTNRRYVVPSGKIIGLRLFTDGVMIVGSDEVDTQRGSVNPSKASKLQTGDVITAINGIKIEGSSQVEKMITESCGDELVIEYMRNSISYTAKLTPVYSISEKKYKTGLWIRDSAAGIGTMTFYEKSTGFFACLGHAVCDIDTGKILPLANGDIVDATISGCVRGKAGSAGELCGSFKNRGLGSLLLNDESGVFGCLDNVADTAEEIPIAIKSEIKTGSARIISTVDGETTAYYDVEIEKLNPDDKDGKNMVIKITDSKLIEKTGGIVQGMSGSPIIQEGRLVGAVTHVFLNDPTRGYGIFAETMLNKAHSVGIKQAG